MGRPSSYTNEIFYEILSKLADGISLKRICSEEGMPGKSSFYRWLDGDNDLSEEENRGLRDKYARAKEDSADALADDIQDIANDVLTGKVDPNAGRVAGDLKKWSASKLKPKKYGDKIDMTTGGESFNDGSSLSNDELRAIISESLKHDKSD